MGMLFQYQLLSKNIFLSATATVDLPSCICVPLYVCLPARLRRSTNENAVANKHSGPVSTGQQGLNDKSYNNGEERTGEWIGPSNNGSPVLVFSSVAHRSADGHIEHTLACARVPTRANKSRHTR